MNYHHMQNKEIGNINQNFYRNPPSQQNNPNNLYNQMKYENKNYKGVNIQNNLINTGLDYHQDFSIQGMNNNYLQHNNYINNNNDIKPNNNLINNNLIYQDYNQYNIYNDPRNKQELNERDLGQQKIQNYEMKEKSKVLPNNLNGNINKLITRPQMNEEEKAKHRKKQKEYNEELRKQIEEKRRRKEIEKKKEEEEDLKIENKIKRHILEERQKEEELKKQMKLKKQKELEEIDEINRMNSKKKNNNMVENYYNNQMDETSSTAFNNMGNNFYGQGLNQQYPPNEPQSLPVMSTNRTNISSNSNNNNMNNINNKNKIEDYYKKFVQDQLGIIEEYEEKVNNCNSNNFNYNQLLNERNEAMKQIQISQDTFQINFGMLPMNDQFNKKVANFMDIILEQKVKEIQYNNNYNNNYINVNSSKKNYNNINNINKNLYNNNSNLISGEFKKSSDYVNLDENALSEKKPMNFIGITDESQIRRDIVGCGYQSKYEQLRESILNGDDISNELKVSRISSNNNKLKAN